MDDKVLEKINLFFSPFKEQKIKKGEVLINSFENPNNIFLLEKGWVKMYSINKNGDELILNVFKPLTFFPISIAINENSNNYFYETMTEATIRTAPSDKVVEFIKKNPDVLFDLLKRIYKGLDGILQKMEYAMSSDAKSRLILELLIQAKRFGIKKNDEIILNTSISDLALTIGLARETVSRELKQLKDKNLISIDNKTVIINNINNLEEQIS